VPVRIKLEYLIMKLEILSVLSVTWREVSSVWMLQRQQMALHLDQLTLALESWIFFKIIELLLID
jgi:hypothetical protein